MSRVKYQHYVPRFYLDGFKGEGGKLWCYDKKLDRSYPSAPENLGGERLFYDTPKIEKEIGISQFLENWFRPLENAAALHLKNWRSRLASQQQFTPSITEVHDMALFMVVQLLRTPRARQMAVDLHLMAKKISFYNYLGKTQTELAGRIQNPLKELEMTLDKERWPYVHAMFLLDIKRIEEMALTLQRHIWLVSVAPAKRALFTSDNPIIKLPHASHPVLKMSGFSSPGIQIVYPLSPNHSLNLFERTFWKEFERFDRKVFDIPLADANIDFDNSIQVQHSARFIYCREDNFSLAREMCNKTPELRNPHLPELDSRLGNEV